jgi:hypothetical protein
MSADGASDHRAFGSLLITCQGATVESKPGFARTLVQEQGGGDVLLMGQVLTVEVVTEVTVIVEGGAGVGHPDVADEHVETVMVETGTVGQVEVIGVAVELVGGIVVVRMHEHALERREVDAEHAAAKGGMVGELTPPLEGLKSELQ